MLADVFVQAVGANRLFHRSVFPEKRSIGTPVCRRGGSENNALYAMPGRSHKYALCAVNIHIMRFPRMLDGKRNARQGGQMKNTVYCAKYPIQHLDIANVALHIFRPQLKPFGL